MMIMLKDDEEVAFVLLVIYMNSLTDFVIIKVVLSTDVARFLLISVVFLDLYFDRDVDDRAISRSAEHDRRGTHASSK